MKLKIHFIHDDLEIVAEDDVSGESDAVEFAKRALGVVKAAARTLVDLIEEDEDEE
jgi:hypothetical protein